MGYGLASRILALVVVALPPTVVASQELADTVVPLVNIATVP